MSSAKAFTFLPLGAIIQEFTVNGKNIVQGFPTAELYKQYNGPYFGVTIGRIANRVSNATINDLNGKSYPLAANNAPNHLHGGITGWGKREFEGPFTVQRNGKEATFFKYVSPDGEEGYPGTVEFRVWYVQEKEQIDGTQHEVLNIEYEAELIGDEVDETAINVTNHSYFNLTGGATIAGTEAKLFSNRYLVVDENLVPQGPIEDFPGVKPHTTITLGEVEPDFDHCFAINEDANNIGIDSRSEPLAKLAYFYHPESKIHLEISSTEPTFQFYTGKHINVPAVGGVPARGSRAGFCIEPARYVNAINVPEQKSQVALKKGEKYGATIVYRGWHA